MLKDAVFEEVRKLTDNSITDEIIKGYIDFNVAVETTLNEKSIYMLAKGISKEIISNDGKLQH